jgi:acetyl-CoA carboxylase biotin carboxyl carrier protein
MPLDAKDVEEIIRLLDASPYDDLRLETSDFTLVVSRSGSGSAPAGGQGGPSDRAGAAAQVPPTLVETTAPESRSGTGSTATSAHGLVEIRSPHLGTFYRAPKPGADPFVEVGSAVDEQTVVAIVEVMKLMNTVPAGVKGEIVEILGVNGELVEYDEVLFKVRVAEA